MLLYCKHHAYHEGNLLPESLEQHEARFKRLPDVLLADQLYATRANRKLLAQKNIAHSFGHVGRPKKEPDVAIKKAKALTRKRQRQRNHIEAVFGTIKDHLLLDKIRWSVPDAEIMQIQLGLTTFKLKTALKMI